MKREADKSERPKIVKKEKQSKSGADSVRPQEPPSQEEEQGTADRRALRSQYLTLIHKIKGIVRFFFSTYFGFVFSDPNCYLIQITKMI